MGCNQNMPWYSQICPTVKGGGTEKKNHAVHEACRNYEIAMAKSQIKPIISWCSSHRASTTTRQHYLSFPTATNTAQLRNHQNWFNGSQDSPTSMECPLEDLPSNLENSWSNVAAAVCGSNCHIYTCSLIIGVIKKHREVRFVSGTGEWMAYCFIIFWQSQLIN